MKKKEEEEKKRSPTSNQEDQTAVSQAFPINSTKGDKKRDERGRGEGWREGKKVGDAG